MIINRITKEQALTILDEFMGSAKMSEGDAGFMQLLDMTENLTPILAEKKIVRKTRRIYEERIIELARACASNPEEARRLMEETRARQAS